MSTFTRHHYRCDQCHCSLSGKNEVESRQRAVAAGWTIEADYYGNEVHYCPTCVESLEPEHKAAIETMRSSRQA